MENINPDSVINFLKTAGLDLLRGILVLVVGFFLVHWISKLLSRSKKLSVIEPTLRGFLHNLVKILLSVIVILTAVNIMGIPMTSVVTLLASGGVAIGLALQGAVGNLIGGLLLLILRPIKAGEYVKIGDCEGVVKTVGAYYTELVTADNKHIDLPNGNLTNTAITNYSRETTRRLDLTFSVDYSTDLDTVYRVLNDLVAKEPAVLMDPAPQIVFWTRESGRWTPPASPSRSPRWTCMSNLENRHLAFQNSALFRRGVSVSIFHIVSGDGIGV